ncbi:MAG: isoprenylcysteine carboxylmethyltransferase family protein [Bacteroidaceae bacterium]|nr:isoprenylcysteine carboxylmethyltransferase family protein [Bacteroidaceae bacterium]
MLKSFMALPMNVTIVIPIVLLYLSNWHFHGFSLWTTVWGVISLLTGIALLAATIRLFLLVGKGTLAPWDPTQKLVVSGPYAYVRNPMISGVVLILIGESFCLNSWAIGIWSIVFSIVNVLYFILSEEPGLRKRFGKEYEAYCMHVPRLIPRFTPWKPNSQMVQPDKSA